MSSTTNEAATPPDPLALRLDLHANGYEPIPVEGKKARTPGWASGVMTPERIAAEAGEHPQASSTGLRTGKIVGVDIDVDDPAEVAEIVSLVAEVLGPSPFQRVGSKGVMLCYQNAEPIRKIAVASTDKTKVEILGAGQQFVAYGIHPDTGKPYAWINEGSEPAHVETWALPAVTPPQLRDLAPRLAALLAARHPAVKVTGDTGDRPAPVADECSTVGLPLPPDEIEARLAYPDPDMARDEWIRMAGALHATPCTDPSAPRRLFIEWSRRGAATFTSDEDCETAFDTMGPKVGGVTAGTFIRLTNDAGYRGRTVGKTGSPAETFKDYIATATQAATPLAADPAWAARVARFRGREPDEDADLPEPEFWDDQHTLPKFPGGTIGVAYGPSGAHKTTIVTAITIEAIQHRNARVAYFAGEGGYGLGKLRIPALCDAHGIKPRDLRGKYRTIPRVPNLQDQSDVDALIEAQGDFRPDIMVIDTLATALPGADENAASTGSLLTGNGPAGRLRDAYGAATIFVAHSGKDAGKGIRGSSAFAGNVDFVWRITADKDAGTAKLHVEKMKDGPDGFSVFYRLTKAANGVPVAQRIPEAEYRSLQSADTTEAKQQQEVRRALQRLCRAAGGSVTNRVLAEELVPQRPGQSPEEREHALTNETKRLAALTRPNRRTELPGPLVGFVRLDHRGERMNPLEWFVEDDGDDEEADD